MNIEDESLYWIGTIFAFSVIAAMGIALVLIVSTYECRSRWGSFNNRYGIMSGCQIEVGGKFIPVESYYFKEE